MVKCFSKNMETRDVLQLPVISDASFLHLCLQNHHQYFSLIQALDTKRPVASLAKSKFSASASWGMVSHMQVLATPSSTVQNTKYLDPYL